jgi:type II secretory pathway pseudopilin PulG
MATNITAHRRCLGRRTLSGLTLVELLVVLCIIAVVIMLLFPVVRGGSRVPANRTTCLNNMKHIALALQAYAKVHGGELPPAYTTDADGKPLHSWRTLILPYLEAQDLYDSIDLSKPWNDPINAQALKQVPSIYQCPSFENSNNRTTYLAIVTADSCLRATEPRPLSEVTDAAKTLIIIDADSDHAVPWMSPQDADEALILNLGGKDSNLQHQHTMLAAYADGHVAGLSPDLPADQRRALISLATDDNDVLENAN